VRTNVVTSLDGGAVETTLTELVSGTLNGAPL
jgi:hypothetical protein